MFELTRCQVLCSQLAYWLLEVLPQSEMHWEDMVLPHLSAMQRERVRDGVGRDLRRLDLSSLLKVALGNWSEIASVGGYPESFRSLLILAVNMRNELAHLPACEPLPIHQAAMYAEVTGVMVNFLRGARSYESAVA